MASATFGRDSTEFRFFAEYWKFRQQYYEVDKNSPEAFWDACLAEADRISAAYPGRFVTDLLQAHVNDVLHRSGTQLTAGQRR